MDNSAADLILYGGNILTLNPACSRAQLIAVRGDTILSVAADDALPALRGQGTEVVALNGRTVLPGFHDAHCHLVAFAESLLVPNLAPPSVHSISDIQGEIRRFSRELPPGSWIRARGYDEFHLREKRHPTRRDLDEATVLHPVKLTHRSGHAHVLNSSALALAGISGETTEPPGAMIERYLETGEPNGVLYGMGEYLAKVVPLLDDRELARGIELAGERLLASGITSLQDASASNDLRRWQMFLRWKAEGYLKPRAGMMLGVEAFNRHREEGLLPQTGDNQLRLGAVKIILDETRGYLNPPREELNRKVLEIHRAGFQVALHALGETTLDAAFLALEYAIQSSPRRGHRHRIEHCSVCRPEMARRLASLGIAVVTQPSFIYYNGERYLRTVPEEQLRHLYPLATLIEAGLKVSAGSDAPVVSPAPLTGIYAAVSRKAKTGQDLLPEERIPPLAAVEMYTQGAAYVSFEEAIKGSLAPGKLADLVVLSGDPTEVSPEEIRNLHVEMTVVGGKIVWRRGL
ncbi:MAG: amidohydrolase [Syntrophales bacterium]|nr:amidohydrolase [Syntrophales bacterium]